MDQKKIAFFHPDGGLNNNPNLNAFLNLLVEHGFQIDIWSTFDKSNSTLFPDKPGINYFFLQSFSELDIVVSNYSFAIGVDLGIIFASKLAKILSVPYCFISYEIYFDDELVLRSDKVNKQKAKEACKDIAFAIVQDKLRAGLIAKEYAISEDKILYMPVAGYGPIPYKKSKFLHEHLSLDESMKILLHFGSTLSWTMIDWAISKADSLPENWVMVIHDKNLYQGNKSEHPKVYRSNLQSLPLNQMHNLIQSATCCLGLYTPVKGSIYTEKNIEFIGLSSGKVILSLQHGVPVVVNMSGELSELIEKYHAGIVLNVASPQPFNDLINLADISEINENCHQLFDEHLDIKNYVYKIIDAISLTISKPFKFTIDYTHYKDPGEKLLFNYTQMPVKDKINSIFHLFRNLIVSVVKKIMKTQ